MNFDVKSSMKDWDLTRVDPEINSCWASEEMQMNWKYEAMEWVAVLAMPWSQHTSVCV